MSLWSSEDSAKWSKAMEAYSQTIEARGKPRLAELDRFYTAELPGLIAGRKPPHVTAEELVKVVDWKLTRGKFRPRLLDYAKQHSEDVVQATSTEAFRLAESSDGDDGKSAIAELAKLKGIGPATASAVLAGHCPELPFMSDEAMEAALPGGKDYTIPKYLQLVQALRRKAADLGKRGDGMWTASDVERALWANSAAAALTRQKAGPGSGKRKAQQATSKATPSRGGRNTKQKSDAV